MLTCMSACFHSASVHVNNKQYARKMIYINLYKLIESLDNAFYKVSFCYRRFEYLMAFHSIVSLFGMSLFVFETYINGFLDLEYPNFDPKHGFLSSVEAEIISFFQRRQPFAFLAFYVRPLTFEGGSPSKFNK